MKDIHGWAVRHDHDGSWTLRTSEVGDRWTEGPEADCTVYPIAINHKAAMAIYEHVRAELDRPGSGRLG